MKIECNLTDEIVYSYKDYLNTKHWQLIKRIKFNYFVHECAKCQSRVGLELHHKHYESLGKEDLDDLVYLCRECHQKTHDDKKSLKNTYDRLKGYKVRKDRAKNKSVVVGNNTKEIHFEKEMNKNNIMFIKKSKNHYKCKGVDYWPTTRTFYDSKNKYKGKGLKNFIEYIK